MTLIDITSTQYKKRLVRELNKAGSVNGFYAPIATFNVRCNRAKLKDGEIWVHSYACNPEWFAPSRECFDDCNGQQINASVVA